MGKTTRLSEGSTIEQAQNRCLMLSFILALPVYDCPSGASKKPMSDLLKQLYPFLADQQEECDENLLLESIKSKSKDSSVLKESFFSENLHEILSVARTIATVYAGHGKMFAIGNGGSSCDAAHFAVEFQHPVTAGRPALPAVSLCHDTAMLTAVGNDVGFEFIFVRLLEAQATGRDGLIGFSTSGNSRNLLEAFKKAKSIGMKTIAITGGDGGNLASNSCVDHCLVVRSDSIHRIQEVHVTLYHVVWDIVHTLLAAQGLNRSDKEK